MDDLSANIGRKIRETRKAAGLSMSALADLSGLSLAAIQKVETNGMVPTIVSLMKISRALNKSVSFFVEEQEPTGRMALVRRAERKSFYSQASKLRQEYITGDLTGRILEGGVFTADPGGGSGETPGVHSGEEIIMCLSGEVEIEIGEETWLLKPGDTVHFKSDLPHRWNNPGETRAETLWIWDSLAATGSMAGGARGTSSSGE
jgi:transcriptional regulator with XRE-family HTH domain